MWKKSIPLLMATGLVLTACNMDDNNGALPDNNETPMQDVNDRTNQWVPDTGDQNDVQNFDGFEDNGNGMNNGGTGTNDGLIDENGNGNGTDRLNDEDLGTPDLNGNNNASPNTNGGGAR